MADREDQDDQAEGQPLVDLKVHHLDRVQVLDQQLDPTHAMMTNAPSTSAG